MKDRRGAIELSMTTIIVIVIGVTLLILGLAWVRGMFEKVTSLTDQAFDTAEKEIQNNMGPSDKFYVGGLDFALDPGKDRIISVGIQNFGTEGESNMFKIIASSGKQGCEASKWFVLPDEFELFVGDKIGVPVLIKVPKGTEPGKTCPFTIKSEKDGNSYGSQPIIVKVKE